MVIAHVPQYHAQRHNKFYDLRILYFVCKPMANLTFTKHPYLNNFNVQGEFNKFVGELGVWLTDWKMVIFFFHYSPPLLQYIWPTFVLSGLSFEIKVVCLINKPSHCSRLNHQRTKISFHASGTSNFETDNTHLGPGLDYIWRVIICSNLLSWIAAFATLDLCTEIHVHVLSCNRRTPAASFPLRYSSTATLNCLMTLS